MPDHEGEAEMIVPEEVLELLEERARVQDWLDRLAELRDEATPAVYEKVRGDYEERLQGVSGRLAEHRTELERSVARHRSRVEELEKELAAARMRLEEAELRHRVGEYGDEEWERLRREGEARTRDLEGRLAEEGSGLAELERVLGELVSGRRAAEDEEPSEPAAEESGEREGSTGESFVKAWATGQRGLVDAVAAGAASEVGDAEGSDLEEPLAREDHDEAEEPDQPADEPAEEADETVDDAAADYLDELEFLESLSLEDPERFDAVSAMLDEEEEESEEGGREGGPS